MTPSSIPPLLPKRLGPPLAMQLIAILVCALLAAQAVTLALTVLLPPSPAQRWNIAPRSTLTVTRAARPMCSATGIASAGSASCTRACNARWTWMAK